MVCGGSALNVLGLVQRATKDVDVLAYVNRNTAGEVSFISADPLNKNLITASKKVARDFNLTENWLNAGPASATDLGLPNGILKRVSTSPQGFIESYGIQRCRTKALEIYFLKTS